jgi:hypothetical protein
MNFAAVGSQSFIDGDPASSAPFDFECLRGQVGRGTKCGGERDGRAAVGELEIDFDGERAAIVADFIGLFADGLLEFVERELAVFDDSRICDWRLLRQSDAAQENCYMQEREDADKKRCSSFHRDRGIHEMCWVPEDCNGFGVLIAKSCHGASFSLGRFFFTILGRCGGF